MMDKIWNSTLYKLSNKEERLVSKMVVYKILKIIGIF